MKKILAVILSLAMILSMTVTGFAAEVGEDDTTIENNEVVEGGEVTEGEDATEGETTEPDGSKPADPDDVEAWTAYYVVLLTDVTTNPAAVTTVVPEIAANVTDGEISLNAFKTAFGEAAKLVGGDVVNQVVWGVETLLSMDLNSDNYIGKPDGSLEDDGELPEIEDGTDGGLLGGFDITDLLNTVLGFLGSIGDLLFGGSGGDTPTDDPSEDEPWGDDDDNFGDNDSTIPDTGDTTVFAVAAVALAAGAALVMTRKKSEDAE